MKRTTIGAACAALSLAMMTAACGDEKKFPEPKAPTHAPAPTKVTEAAVSAKPAPKDAAVNLDDEIRRLCQIEENDKAPKFDFDSNDLSSAEKDVLGQVARCLTTGPLKGRNVQLVGRADPRGEQEYNMSLGHRRATSVRGYLASLGVAEPRMAETSRGELDATGTDEEGWRKDRRVDIKLMP